MKQDIRGDLKTIKKEEENMSEVIITSQNYESEVLRSDKPVLIDFWASWCGPCKMLGPVIAEIAEEHPEIKVCKVNVDDEEELAAEYNVASIPMLVYMKDGKIVEKSIGFKPKNQILEMVK